MYTVAFDYLMVDGTLPRFGDATTTGISTRNLAAAYHAWREPAFRSLLANKHTWDSVLYGIDPPPDSDGLPAAGNLLKTGAGHGILRIDGSTGPQSAVLAFGPFGGGHGHFDKLSFVHFAMGTELGHDPGRAQSQAYRLPVHRNWYRPTISHNAVMVDRTSQGPAAGEADLFIDSPELAAVMAHTRQAYEGTLHRRLLALRPGYLLVVDELIAEDGASHLYDWLYHQRGDAVSVTGETSATDVAGYGVGFEYIDDARVGETARFTRATFQVGADQVQVTVDAGGDAQILTGTGVGKSVEERIPLLFVTREGVGAHFATVIEAVPKGETAQVTSVEMTPDIAGRWVVRVTFAGGAEDLFDYSHSEDPREVAGVSTTARLLTLRIEDGQATILAEANRL